MLSQNPEVADKTSVLHVGKLRPRMEKGHAQGHPARELLEEPKCDVRFPHVMQEACPHLTLSSDVTEVSSLRICGELLEKHAEYKLLSCFNIVSNSEM